MDEEVIVSLVIPTRNRVETLKDTIKTAINQTTHNHFEVIVSDNGDIRYGDVRALVKSFNDKRILYYKIPI